MSAPAILTISKNGEPVKTIPLDDEALVGRGEGCVIRLDDRAISRKHALFKKNGDVFQVEKKSDFAPLSVNGEEKTSAVLKEGDVISIGPYLMKLTLGVENSPKAEAEPEDGGLSLAAPDLALASAPASTLVSTPVDAASPSAEAAPLDASPILSLSDAQPLPQAEEVAIGPLISDTEPPAGLELSSVSAGAAASSDGSTRVMPSESRLDVALIFQPGQANVTEYRIAKDEISIGRGKDCDVVLADKRASRKNSVISRSGMNFLIRDLSSSNGTYVNGERVEEKDLSDKDRVTIGDTEFVFRAVQPGYSEIEQKIMPLPSLPEEIDSADFPAYESNLAASPVPEPLSPVNTDVPPEAGSLSMGNIAGIAGVAGAASNKKLSIVDKFKALPPVRKALVSLAIIVFVYWFLDDGDQTVAKKAPVPRPKASQSANAAVAAKDAAAAFAALTPEQKKFVESQHDLAFSLFQRKDYDRAIDEISKIFTLVPDYKDSREIERYAREGKRRLDAELEERRKHEEEEALKRKIVGMVADAANKMNAKEYDAARDVFSQILAVDPENKQVAAWQHQLQEIDEERKIQEQRKIVQQEINAQAWALYKEGVGLRKHGAQKESVVAFTKTIKVDAPDRRPASLAKKQIASIHQEIRDKLVPLLEDAKKAEDAQEFVQAMHDYEKALAVDSSSEEANAGMDRLRSILHDRGKVIFTEAIIAESYSDFSQAKKKFKECLQETPDDDSYHARCERKIARYFDTSGGSSQGNGGEQSQ
ncbi:MAG: FHA domain-containing protein [Oligoflexia bacterium]|nr:FHA domain-containing protein [Oligoflexia bacterium]